MDLGFTRWQVYMYAKAKIAIRKLLFGTKIHALELKLILLINWSLLAGVQVSQRQQDEPRETLRTLVDRVPTGGTCWESVDVKLITGLLSLVPWQLSGPRFSSNADRQKNFYLTLFHSQHSWPLTNFFCGFVLCLYQMKFDFMLLIDLFLNVTRSVDEQFQKFRIFLFFNTIFFGCHLYILASIFSSCYIAI